MKTSVRIFLSAVMTCLVAACAPISKEQVASTARPSDATAEVEHFWDLETKAKMREVLTAVDTACSSAPECVSGKIAAAWPNAAQYQPYCQSGDTVQIRTQCLLEYEFWAKTGQRFNPSYQLRNAWASFDLTNNPTFEKWHNDRFFACNPSMNKSQEVVDTCMRDTAKRDFSVSYDATKGCYYNNSLLLATFCYWMAGFDLFALERIDTLAAGT